MGARPDEMTKLWELQCHSRGWDVEEQGCLEVDGERGSSRATPLLLSEVRGIVRADNEVERSRGGLRCGEA